MERFLGRYEPYFYALLRIVSGFMFLLHGTQKLFAFPPPAKAMEGSTFMTVTGALELVLGLLIMVGFLGGYAAFLASGMMAVAYFMAHQPNGALPIQNGGELAALFSFVFLYIASRGSGALSVDATMRRGTATTAPGARA